MKKSKPSASHEAAIIRELRNDPAFAVEYLNAAMEPGNGHVTTLLALRQVVEARGGIGKLAKAVGCDPRSLGRTLSPASDSPVATVLAVLKAMGLSLSVEPANTKRQPTEMARCSRRLGPS